MNLVKIGKFIQQMRKEQGLTQSEMAEKLGVSDRAVSKWENGVCLPDADNMVELCALLGISVNDLFCGERTEMNNDRQIEELLVGLAKSKQDADKRLLVSEIIIGLWSAVLLLAAVLVSGLVAMPIWSRILIVVGGAVLFLVGAMMALRIEQKAGYYRCAKCHHCYVPDYKQVLLAMHAGRTRYLKCPHCGKWSWQKKVLTDQTDPGNPQ